MVPRKREISVGEAHGGREAIGMGGVLEDEGGEGRGGSTAGVGCGFDGDERDGCVRRNPEGGDTGEGYGWARTVAGALRRDARGGNLIVRRELEDRGEAKFSCSTSLATCLDGGCFVKWPSRNDSSGN
jgi:hypothetical protein